jgi:PAS domain S-box-containing protein
MNTWFAVLELPFLLLATGFGFLTAKTVIKSTIGRGMAFVALGSLVMAVGHIIMMSDQLWQEHILAELLGNVVGAWAWLVALCTSWLFYGLGFFWIYETLPQRETELRLVARSHEQAVEALRHSEDLYRSLVEAVRDVIYTLSPDAKFTSLNPAFELYTGWSRSDWVGQPYAPIIHPEDLPLAMERFRQVLAGESLPRFTLRIRDKTGGYRVSEFIQTAQLRNGEVVGVLGVGRDVTDRMKAEEALRKAYDELERRVEERTAELEETNRALKAEILDRQRIGEALIEDITERKQAEEALRESEERFRSVTQSAHDAIIVADQRGHILSWNRGAHTMFGYSETEVLNQPLTLVIPTRYHEVYGLAMARVVRSDETNLFGPTCELDGLRKDGTEFPLEMSLAVWRTNTGAFSSAIIRDLTERKRNEQARARLTAVLFEEAERRRIARELHDQIGQMLTALKLTLEAAGRHPDGASGGKLEIAQRSVEELIRQVHDMSLDLRPPMLDDLGLLPALLWLFQRCADQTNVRVTFEHTGLERRFAQEVETAAYRIVQEALTNISRHARVTDVIVRVWTDNCTLWVQVEDKGIGFDVSLKSSRTMGLTGMRERACGLGGDLTVESAPGRGTRVTAELPFELPVKQWKLGEG